MSELHPSKILPAHHKLAIPVELLNRVRNGFQTLKDQGKLVQGNGIFDFNEFQIHI